jgi:hypothetical protein
MSSNYTKQQEGLATFCGFSLLRLSKFVAQAQRQKAKIPRATKEFHRAVLRAAMAWAPALSKGKGVGAARNWHPRPSRPSPHDLFSFLRSGEGQRAAQLPAGRSFDTAKGARAGKERPPRGSRCRFIKMANHEAVGLGRSSVRRSPIFSRLHAQPGAAPCVSLRDHGCDLRLVALRDLKHRQQSVGAVRICRCSAAAAPLSRRCLPFGGSGSVPGWMRVRPLGGRRGSLLRSEWQLVQRERLGDFLACGAGGD